MKLVFSSTNEKKSSLLAVQRVCRGLSLTQPVSESGASGGLSALWCRRSSGAECELGWAAKDLRGGS